MIESDDKKETLNETEMLCQEVKNLSRKMDKMEEKIASLQPMNPPSPSMPQIAEGAPSPLVNPLEVKQNPKEEEDLGKTGELPPHLPLPQQKKKPLVI